MKHEWENRGPVQMFAESVRLYGRREALRSSYGSYTYRELNREINKLVTGLTEIGVKKGDHVAYFLGGYPEWVLLHYAVLKLGATLVPGNITFKTTEIKYLLQAVDAQTIVVNDEFRGTNFVEILNSIIPELKDAKPGELQAADFPKLKNIIFLSKDKRQKYDFAYDFGEVLQKGQGYFSRDVDTLSAGIDAQSVGYLMLTSGSTALPKPAMCTHENLMYVAACHADASQFNENDVFLAIPPNYHNAGLVSLLATHLRGGCYRVMNFYNGPEALEILEHERCTISFGFGAHFKIMSEVPNFTDYDVFGCLKAVMKPHEQYDLLKEEFGVGHQAQIFGLTEATSTVSVLPMGLTRDPEKLKYSCGKPLPFTEVKVVNPETGQRQAPGEPGELCFKGPNLFKGYYKMPEATAACLDEEGFFHTGDFGSMDQEGYIYYIGRLKQMIKTGGENVSMREVEFFLEDQCPWIQTAQVVGVPDEKWGEAVIALVELTSAGASKTTEELREWCKGKIANFKIPKVFLPVNPGEWPVTPAGKYDKQALREKAIRELGLS